MNVTIRRSAGEMALFYRRLSVHYEWKRRREDWYYNCGLGDVFADSAEDAEHRWKYYAGCAAKLQDAVSSGSAQVMEAMTAQVSLRDHPLIMAALEFGWTIEDYLNGWSCREPGRRKKSQFEKRKDARCIKSPAAGAADDPDKHSLVFQITAAS